ncbi:H-NS family nucleoid-associated regulatory protein [Mesorhizobium opportunistum]|uniref:H-NS family nucleoid-associated regulatory protein n=1 Tax=Mesorhizobium opportunistum TaxID=593909 RepID=UPI000310E902|nr:H-NS family nucleoid-associated regulatory protein [Mesorhizobium opportunistum]
MNGNRVGNGKLALDVGKSPAKSKVTHRGPNGETWTSRGAKPRWLVALIAEGKSADDFKVSG